jgi:anaerobic ribonucleoside-triphosphate reductase
MDKFVKLVNEYIGTEKHWRVLENANMGYSVQGLNNFIKERVSATYWLQEIYTKEIAEAHISASLHIHDLGSLCAYCCGWDLLDLLTVGMRGVSGKIEADPPKHFQSAIDQIINFLFSLSGEIAGAVAFSNFDTFLAPFVLYDGLSYDEVKQFIQGFVFKINTPTRTGFQCISEDTEILTSSGWKKFFEISIGDSIKTFNINTNSIEDQVVQNVFTSSYRGEMYSLKTQDTDQLISPQHRVVWKKNANSIYTITPIEECLNNNSIILPMVDRIESIDDLPLLVKDADLTVKDQVVQKKDVTKVYYNGIIWCPTTINGTIIARRNGKVFITGNCPFSNITMDLNVPSSLRDTPVILGGKSDWHIGTYDGYRMGIYDKEEVEVSKKHDKDEEVYYKEKDMEYINKYSYKTAVYGDFQVEMDMINEAFCEVMIEGDSKGRIHTFPIPTYNLTKEFQWDDPKFEKMWEMTSKYGNAYFGNYINSGMNPEDSRSFCCRLNLSLKDLQQRNGGLFASAPLTGSIGVVTINMPRIAYLAKKQVDSTLVSSEYYRRLDELLVIARNSLVIKRKYIENQTELGLYPYAKFYLRNIKERRGEYWYNHFNTIGILGMNEACEIIYGSDIISNEGKQLAIDTLLHIRKRLLEFQEEDNMLYNLEATPGEGTTYRFAKADKEEFKDIITQGKKYPYYTNSTNVPVDWSSNLFEILDHQNDILPLYNGGSANHNYIGESIKNFNVCKDLVKKIATNYKIPYFSITPTFSVCLIHGYMSGEHFKCPTCGEDCEVYSRVVGFYRPITQWNVGKQEEFRDRKVATYDA